MSDLTSKQSPLVVTKGGVPFADQAEGLRQFKEACLTAETVPQKLERLTAEVAKWKQERDEQGRHAVDLFDECVRLKAEVAELRRDAERYRWLREGDYTRKQERSLFHDTGDGVGELLLSHELDAAIDAARAALGDSRDA